MEERIETMETENTEIQDVVIYDLDCESGSDEKSGIVPVVVGVLAVGAAIGIGVKTVGPKIKKWNEDRILAKADKIKADRKLEVYEEDVEAEVIDAEVIDAEETE